MPEDTWAIIGHTRMTTQGSAKKNRNNHPFSGHVKGGSFALAHNGVLYNDKYLRHSLALPQTKIETDSYIAVQLIEQKSTLNFDSLRYMAEQVEGSFTFTALDKQNIVYIVKGDNPLYLLHFPMLGLYIYASTEEILQKAVSRMWLSGREASHIMLNCGEILRIDDAGKITRSHFDDSNLFFWYEPFQRPCSRVSQGTYGLSKLTAPQSYLDEVKSVAAAFGYTPEAIDRLAEKGFSAEEIEEFLYCGEV